MIRIQSWVDNLEGIASGCRIQCRGRQGRLGRGSPLGARALLRLTPRAEGAPNTPQTPRTTEILLPYPARAGCPPARFTPRRTPRQAHSPLRTSAKTMTDGLAFNAAPDRDRKEARGLARGRPGVGSAGPLPAVRPPLSSCQASIWSPSHTFFATSFNHNQPQGTTDVQW